MKALSDCIKKNGNYGALHDREDDRIFQAMRHRVGTNEYSKLKLERYLVLIKTFQGEKGCRNENAYSKDGQNQDDLDFGHFDDGDRNNLAESRTVRPGRRWLPSPTWESSRYRRNAWRLPQSFPAALLPTSLRRCLMNKARNLILSSGMRCKYVIFDDLNLAIFSAGKGHKEFAKAGVITSAGMLKFYVNESGHIDVATFGASESLRIDSRPEDADIIRGMLGLGDMREHSQEGE